MDKYIHRISTHWSTTSIMKVTCVTIATRKGHLLHWSSNTHAEEKHARSNSEYRPQFIKDNDTSRNDTGKKLSVASTPTTPSFYLLTLQVRHP
jgi:hypothetical protein